MVGLLRVSRYSARIEITILCLFAPCLLLSNLHLMTFPCLGLSLVLPSPPEYVKNPPVVVLKGNGGKTVLLYLQATPLTLDVHSAINQHGSNLLLQHQRAMCHACRGPGANCECDIMTATLLRRIDALHNSMHICMAVHTFFRTPQI